MAEQRHLVPQRLVDQDLFGRIVDMVVSPNDVGNPHLGVVDDDREVVRRIPVGPLQDQIIQLLVIKRDIPFDQVVHDRCAHLRTAEPDHRTRAPGKFPVPAGPIVFWFPPLGQRFFPLGLQFVGGAGAVIRLPLVNQLLNHLPVDLHPLCLKIGSLVPVQAKPGHGIEDRPGRFVRRADLIGILDPEDERAAAPSRIEPIE